jgi:hypothetical protein
MEQMQNPFGIPEQQPNFDAVHAAMQGSASELNFGGQIPEANFKLELGGESIQDVVAREEETKFMAAAREAAGVALLNYSFDQMVSAQVDEMVQTAYTLAEQERKKKDLVDA